MTSKIIVDGYNLMLAGSGASPRRILDLEKGREELLHKLAGYRKNTGHKILIIFDGSSEADIYDSRTKVAGIEVLFSRSPQSADDKIKSMAADSGGGCIVVTSDREVSDAVERMGCTTVSSREFMGKMELAGLMESEGDISDGDNFEPRWGTKKKGNPKRLSKKERRRNTRLKKL